MLAVVTYQALNYWHTLLVTSARTKQTNAQTHKRTHAQGVGVVVTVRYFLCVTRVANACRRACVRFLRQPFCVARCLPTFAQRFCCQKVAVAVHREIESDETY